MNNRQSMYSSIAVAILIACVIVSGCSAKSDAPTMVAVSGTLSIDGKPQENISVTFIPDNSKGTQGPASVGRTNADGKFTLTGPGNRTGAMIGFHKVTVACPFNPAGGSSATGVASDGAAPCKLPLSLADPEKTKLTAEVKSNAAENQNVVLDVSSK